MEPRIRLDNVFGNPYSYGTVFVVAFPVVTASGEEIILTVLSLIAASGIFQEFQDPGIGINFHASQFT